MRAQQIGAHGGKPLLRIHAESLKGANVAKAEKAFAAWTVVPDAGNIAPKLAAFKKLGKGRRVYLDYHRIDRYLCGFYAAGMDADGVFVGGLFFSGGTAYSGDGVDGRGLLVPAERGVGNFKPTINAIHLARGRDDYVLVRRCENLLEKAAKGRVAAAELEQALGALRDAVTRHGGLGYDSIDMRTSNVPPSKLQTLRIGLVQAAAAVSNRLKGRD
jgi:hypothetical protein